jgi:hypothetical protein
MVKPKTHDGLGQPGGLRGIDGLGLTFGHTAKPTASGADIAQDHERRRFLGIALHAVGTFCVVADRLQPQLVNQVRSEMVSVALGDIPFQPAGEVFRGCGHLFAVQELELPIHKKYNEDAAQCRRRDIISNPPYPRKLKELRYGKAEP